MRKRSLPYILANNDVVHFHIDQTYIFIELYDANVAYTYVRIFFYYFYWILNAKMTQAKHTYILQHIFFASSFISFKSNHFFHFCVVVAVFFVFIFTIEIFEFPFTFVHFSSMLSQTNHETSNQLVPKTFDSTEHFGITYMELFMHEHLCCKFVAQSD